MVLTQKTFINILESQLSKEKIKEYWGDVWSRDWGDSELEKLFEENKGTKQKVLVVKYDHYKQVESERDQYLKERNDLLAEKNKLIAERDARPNITHEEWIEKQKEVYDLTYELKKVKNQEKDLALREKTIQELTQDNQKAQTEADRWKKKYEDLEDKESKKIKEIEEINNKLNRSDLTEEEKSAYKRKLITAQQELSNIKNEKKGTLDKINELANRISNNNKTIANVGSGSSDRGKEGIWQFITLENILIVLAVYALWKIVQNEQR